MLRPDFSVVVAPPFFPASTMPPVKDEIKLPSLYADQYTLLARTTDKEPLEVTVPQDVVTVIGPVKFPIKGMAKTICVPDTLITVAAVPLILTVLPVVKFVPVTVTVVPGEPLAGVKFMMVASPPVGEWSHELTAGGIFQLIDANVRSGEHIE